MLETAGLAILLFITTNIDDVFILLAFFADPKYRTRDIVAGQYLGIAALVAASAAISIAALMVPSTYIGLLGLLPILIGLQKLVALTKGDSAEDEEHIDTKNFGAGNALTIAAVTIANGGDNIGVYTPVFATSAFADLMIIVVVFAVLVAALVGFAHYVVNHPRIGAGVRRYAHIAVPFALIAIGVFVLYDADSFSLLRFGNGAVR
jgi:cadmium resistance protein CadD (predicted permease)